MPILFLSGQAHAHIVGNGQMNINCSLFDAILLLFYSVSKRSFLVEQMAASARRN